DQVSRPAPVEPHCEGAEARQHEEPEKQRARLAAPEGRDRVLRRELPARRVRDVDEREVVPNECHEEDDCRNERRAERGDECIPRGERQPPATEVSGRRPRYEGVQDEPEGDEEGSTTQLGHQRTRLRRRSSSASTWMGTS